MRQATGQENAQATGQATADGPFVAVSRPDNPARSSANASSRRGILLARGSAIALMLAASLAMAGCKRISSMRASLGDITGSTPSTKVPTDAIGIRRYVRLWGERYQRHPNDTNTARNFARGLRAAGRAPQAVAVLRRAVIRDAKNQALLADYGKALVDAGKLVEAARVLERAQTPENPNWSIQSALGSIADQQGEHELAQQYYVSAMKIAPNEPSIMSNLGLSYALSRRLPLAERTLRRAVKHPRADNRIRQNLSLVLALQGKFDEAELIQRQMLPPHAAAQNIAAIRRMIAQNNTWREIQNLDGKPARKGSQKNARNSRRR